MSTDNRRIPDDHPSRKTPTAGWRNQFYNERGSWISHPVFVQRTVAQIREAAELAVKIQKKFEELAT